MKITKNRLSGMIGFVYSSWVTFANLLGVKYGVVEAIVPTFQSFIDLALGVAVAAWVVITITGVLKK